MATFKQLMKESEEARKKEARDLIVTASDTKDSKGMNSAERVEMKTFFEALASGDKAKIQESNDIQVKGYEKKGYDWRTAEESRAKAQTVGTIGTTTNGGILVPTYLRDQLIEKQYYISPMRQVSTVINDIPASFDLPFDNALPTAAWTAEGTAIAESAATFSKKNLQPKKLAGFDSFTSESLVDTAFNGALQDIVVNRFATAMSLAENAAFVSGTGTGQPWGFRSSDITPTTLATNGTAGNLAYTDLVQQYFTLPTAYRNQAVWVTSSAGVQLLDNIKDSSGRPVFLPGYTGVSNENLVPGTLFGRPLYIVDEIPTNLGTGTNETQLWFGVFKNYVIGTRGSYRVEYGTNGTDFAQDKVSLRIIERLDARPYLDVSWTVKNIK